MKNRTSEPLRPNLEAWSGLRVVADTIARLDSAALVPLGAFAAIGYCATQQADWVPYASIISIALSAMLLQRGRAHAATPIESTKDPPQPGGLAVRPGPA